MESTEVIAMPPTPLDELRALRSELLTRILLQNLLIVLSVFAFAILVTLGFFNDTMQWPLCAMHAVASLAFSLQWCHHGVRTMQIKQYILTHEPPTSHSWENWLPINRPKRWLGTRWLVSTKGVFLGTQLAAILFAASNAKWTRNDWFFPLISIALLLLTAGFLFTNPKE